MGRSSMRVGASLLCGAWRDGFGRERKGPCKQPILVDSACPSLSRSKMVEDADTVESDFAKSLSVLHSEALYKPINVE